MRHVSERRYNAMLRRGAELEKENAALKAHINKLEAQISGLQNEIQDSDKPSLPDHEFEYGAA